MEKGVPLGEEAVLADSGRAGEVAVVVGRVRSASCYVVMAPSEADETCRAYLPITPEV
jgi:hypothetical protein